MAEGGSGLDGSASLAIRQASKVNGSHGAEQNPAGSTNGPLSSSSDRDNLCFPEVARCPAAWDCCCLSCSPARVVRAATTLHPHRRHPRRMLRSTPKVGWGMGPILRTHPRLIPNQKTIQIRILRNLKVRRRIPRPTHLVLVPVMGRYAPTMVVDSLAVPAIREKYVKTTLVFVIPHYHPVGLLRSLHGAIIPCWFPRLRPPIMAPTTSTRPTSTMLEAFP